MNECKFAETLVQFRTAKGVTQEEVAQSLSISNKTVSKWENGVSTPDLPMLMALSKYFHVTTDSLLGLAEEESFDTPKTIRSAFVGLDRKEAVLKTFEIEKSIIPAMYDTFAKHKEDVNDNENVFPAEVSHFYRSQISTPECYRFLAHSEDINLAVMLLRNKKNFAWMCDPDIKKRL